MGRGRRSEARVLVALNDLGEVRAAGAVPCRAGADGRLEVLLVHRPQYDDWTLPKGKAEAGERDEDCALREVEEETGLRGALGRELPSVHWRDRYDRPKVARYWVLVPDAGSEAVGTNEVDTVEWRPLADAVERLSYERDAEVLRALSDDDAPGAGPGTER